MPIREIKSRYKGREIRQIKIKYTRLFISGIRRNSVSASRVIQNAAARGKSTSFIGLSLALLTRISRPTLRAQVKKFEKYII